MNFKLSSLFLLMGIFFMTSCTKENIDNINIEDPTVDPTVVQCNLDVLIENNNSVLKAIVNGDAPPFKYNWSTGETTDEIRVATNGDYSLTVTDADGCTVSKSITVDSTDPCIGLNGVIDVRRNSSEAVLTANITGGMPPYVYEWHTGATTQSITVNLGGRYQVFVTDAEGCGLVLEVDLGNSDPCDDFIGRIEVDSTTPAGYILNLIVSGGTEPYIYTWSDGGVTPDNTASAPGTYEVVVTDANGCVIRLSVTVGGTDPCASLNLRIGEQPPGSGILYAGVGGGTAPYAYEWSTGETTNSITVADPGTYSLTVTDADGCMVESRYDYSNPCSDLQTNSFYDETAKIIETDPSGGTAPYNVRWSTGETTFEISVTSGMYTLFLADAEGCTITETFQIP